MAASSKAKSAAGANDGGTASLRIVERALERGEVRTGNLSARGLAAVLGQTTSVIYHRWGSLDGLLFAVATLGWSDLAAALEAGTEARAKKLPEKIAETYVTFGLDRPALYRLMTDHPFDRDALRASGVVSKKPSALAVVKIFLTAFSKRGPEPEVDAQIFHAGLHGLVMLSTDREASLRSARRLARKLG